MPYADIFCLKNILAFFFIAAVLSSPTFFQHFSIVL